MLALTFAIFACGVSLLSTGATIPLARVVVVTSCNLKLVVFFLQIVHLHMWWFTLCNLHWWCFFYQPTGATTVLALGQLALCGGGKYIHIYIYIYIYIYTYIHHYHHHTPPPPLPPPPPQVVMHAFNTCATALGKITDHAYCGPGHPSDHHMCQRVHGTMVEHQQRKLQRVRTCIATVGVIDAASTCKLA